MKKIVFLFMALAVMFTSCDLDTFDNGDLEGMWKVQGIDSLTNGRYVDKSQTQMAFAVQKMLLQLSGAGATVLCRFEHKGDSLVVYDPRKPGSNNPPVETVDALRPYSFTSLRMSFHIDLLNGKRMILRTDDLKLYFEKY